MSGGLTLDTAACSQMKILWQMSRGLSIVGKFVTESVKLADDWLTGLSKTDREAYKEAMAKRRNLIKDTGIEVRAIRRELFIVSNRVARGSEEFPSVEVCFKGRFSGFKEKMEKLYKRYNDLISTFKELGEQLRSSSRWKKGVCTVLGVLAGLTCAAGAVLLILHAIPAVPFLLVGGYLVAVAVPTAATGGASVALGLSDPKKKFDPVIAGLEACKAQLEGIGTAVGEVVAEMSPECLTDLTRKEFTDALEHLVTLCDDVIKKCDAV